ncbi:MAG: flagellar biosynthetic protein FliR [Planctomycetota bacterium]
MLAALVTARIGGLFFFAPVISSSGIPSQVKVALVLALTAAVYPAILPAMLERNPGALAEFPPTFLSLVPLLVFEVLVGFTIGFMAALPLFAAQLAGLVIGQQMGVALAEEYDPASGVNSNVISHMLYYLAVIGFLMLGGADLLVLAVLRSFETVPIGGFRSDDRILAWLISLLSASYELAIRLAAPVLCMLSLQSVALGFINKTAQAFNIMSLGFPMRVIIGFVIVIVSVTAINEALGDAILDDLDGIFMVFDAW